MFDFFNTPETQGKFGEDLVDIVNSIALDKRIYQQLNHVTLPLKNGGSTQLDHVIVSIYGIFVIETKNYRGMIFGSPEQEQWTQATYSGKYRFKNPLKQNAYHIKVLANLLGLAESHFYSVIAFMGDCEFMTPMPKNVRQEDYFVYIMQQRQVLFDQVQVQDIIEKIQNLRLQKSAETDQKHNAYVKDKMNHPSCPICHSTMIKRVAKKGTNQGSEFWGCSRFPQCRGTKAINTQPSNEQISARELERIIRALF